MRKLMDRIWELGDMAYSGLFCMYIAYMRYPASCPACWKCMAIRAVLVFLAVILLMELPTEIVVLLICGAVFWGVSYGDGFWAKIRHKLIGGPSA